MQLIDIGVNLTHPSLAREREAVLERARAAGVCQLVLTGTSLEESERALTFCRELDDSGLQLFSTAGVHPHDASQWNADSAGQLRALLDEAPVRAVGECGLDFNRDFSPRPVQIEWFRKQVALAKELEMPLFLHERDAAVPVRRHLAGFIERAVFIDSRDPPPFLPVGDLTAPPARAMRFEQDGEFFKAYDVAMQALAAPDTVGGIRLAKDLT